ncbi:Inositol-1-monophosphatase [Pannonibacter phragmitetus]|uniref:Inositol-1-monophosphatase n=1 Tax=Pannonibacter phragmitetus TaxID=121719 RepID=A0A378ZVU5_9HYPH|nr:inositol monophosphatase family protein [Pannonibacter phragmitetus]SUB01113.1 Inositol-1-monophosphatase [Pannonibacter phragmitetus]
MTAPSSKIWDWLIDEVRAGAAEEILPRFRRLSSDMVSAKSAPDDLVTEADRQMKQRLREACARLMPQALFLGEEAVSADRSLLEALPQAELAILCDPVDGTWNFANGLAVFGVIIAVLRRGEPVFGLLYDPLGDDWVMAERGAGAFFARPGSEPERLSVQPGPAGQGRALPDSCRCTCFQSKTGRGLQLAWLNSAGRLRCAAPATNTACWRRAASTSTSALTFSPGIISPVRWRWRRQAV